MLPQRCLCGNNLLRITMMVVFGLANLNNGLTSYVTQDNINNELHRNINQNLIISPASAGISGPIVTSNYNGAAPQPPAQPAPGHGTFHGSYSAAFTSSSDMPYPPSSISASSSYHQHQHQQQQQQQQLNLQQPYHQTSGSSITSFDSANVIDERHQQRHTHQHQQQQQQQQLQHLARPLHKVIGVGLGGGASGGGVGGLEHNSLGEATLDGSAESANAGLEEIYAAPMYFGTENSTIVTTQIGASAHIPCTVHHIGDGVVSWIRKKDYHLLTVGLTTYSSDERFSATHLKHSEDWTLQIKFVQLRDAGVYECQVSTHPPTSIFLHLNVVEARAEISGPPIRYLTPGSTLRLQCRVVQNTEASEFIFWYHDNRMINYDSDRGINVSTEPDFQSSELTIQRTRREHSGNFTCVASNTQPASVLVHIFKGDNPAAMYHGHVGGSTKSYQTHLHGITAVIAMAYRIIQTYVHVNLA